MNFQFFDITTLCQNRCACWALIITGIIYTGYLASAEVSGAVSTCAYFQTLPKYPAYAIFTTSVKEIFTHAVLVTSVLQIWFMHISAGPKKCRNQGPSVR
jgi:hypothetical protein